MTTATLFDDVEVAAAYADHRGIADETFMDEVARSLGAPSGLVADIGAGTGTPATALAARGYDVIAVEPSPAMIAEGIRRCPDVAFVRGVAEDLPLPDTSCDGVLLLYVLHHTEDPEAVLAEARRVARPAGRVIVVSGSHDCARQRLFSSYFPILAPDLPDAEEISIYARAAGLRLTGVRAVEHWVYPNRTIDDAYIRMVSTEMFAALRRLHEAEFAEGLSRLRADLGQPLPPARVSLLTLER